MKFFLIILKILIIVFNNYAFSQTTIFYNEKDKTCNDYDAKYCRFNLFIDPDTLYIKGYITSYFKCVQNLNEINFELSYAINVDSVIFHNQKVNFFHGIDDKLQIFLPFTINQGEIDSITIYYQGSPISEGGFGSFVKDYHNGVPIIWTLSEPYGSKDWWPVKSALQDKIDSIDIIVKTPQPYRVASNGVLIAEVYSNDTIITHWKHKYPISPYLVGLAVTNYIDYSDYVEFANDTLQILNYVFPENFNTAQLKSKDIIPIFKLYDSLFITYPFIKEKYGQAEFLWGGGMEHQTMTFISNFEHGLMAHELAHSWFGNYITCGSWQHIWLNEGFATYLTGLTYQYMFNGYWWNTWKHMTIQHVLSQPDGSVFCYDTTNVSRIFDGRLSYNKGSLILHMLRWVIGDLAFFIGIKNYLNDTNLAYSYAYSDDFIQHMELAADTSLYDFFNAWLYGEGYPIYEIKCDIISNTKMKLSVHQYTSHPSVSVYKMPLPIQFKSQDKDTIIVFNNYLNYQEWFIDLGFVPDTIIFDPYMWLLAKVNSIIINDYRENVNGLNVVPNPVSDYFTIWHTDAIINDISLINLLGQQLVLLNNVEIIPYDKVNISVKQLNKGLWILKVKTVNGIILKKIIKL